jgi:aromatic-amino-acid transaminase
MRQHAGKETLDRMKTIRRALARATPAFAAMLEQRGMFGLLPITQDAITQLRIEKAIYMAPSGRINIAGLRRGDIPTFVSAIGH